MTFGDVRRFYPRQRSLDFSFPLYRHLLRISIRWPFFDSLAEQCEFIELTFARRKRVLITLFFRLAGSQAGAYSYVSEFHTNKLAPRAVAFCMICLNGLIIFTSIAAIIIIPMEFQWQIFFIDFKSWRLYLICNSFINLFNGFIFMVLPESPKFLLTIQRHDQALDVLKRVYAFNTGQPKEVSLSSLLSVA